MAVKNRRMDELAARNATLEAAVQRFRRDYAAGRVTLADLPQLKRAHPTFGIYPCTAGGIEFVMFSANDDVVVWDYIWRGEDGYETELVKTWIGWCRERPGPVLDIGGYTGLMSLVAAHAHPENEMHLFEPIERILERASVNVKLNGFGRRIRLHPYAASDRAGEVKMNLYRDENFLSTGSAIDAKAGKELRGVKTIHTVTVDAYLPGIAPTVVKIDVEGHELATLRGMEETIARARPHMLIEVWEPTRDAVLEFLRGHGYALTRTEAEDRRVNNYLALPRG